MRALFIAVILSQCVSFFFPPDVSAQTLEYDTDRSGMDYRNFDLSAPDPGLCERACAENPACKAFTYVKPGIQGPNARCWLKTGVPPARQSSCCVSGVKKSDAEAPVMVQTAPQFKVMTSGALETDSNRPGMDYRNFDLSDPDPELCRQACAQDQQCRAFTYVKPGVQGTTARCWLKNGVPPSQSSPCCISGVKADESSNPETQNATPIQLPGTLSPSKSKDPNALERQKQMLQFRNSWRSSTKRVLFDYNREMLKLQDSSYQNRVQKLNMQFRQDTAAGHAAAFAPEYVKQLAVKQLAVINPKTKPVQTQMIMTPKVTGVYSLGSSEADRKLNEVKSGGFIEITGSNFGSCGSGCGVRIEYSGNPMQGEIFVKDAPPAPKYVKELLPIGGVWAKSWNDASIVAQVPEITEFPISTAAKVVVWKGGPQSFAVTHPVTLFPGVPGIHYILTAPEYGDGKNTNAITSGGEFLIYGQDFGNQPGEVYLELTSPIGGISKIDLTKSSQWTDRVIHVKMPKIPGQYGFQTAKLNVRKGNSQAPAMEPVRFGPRMVAKWVPGTSFFDLDYGKGEAPSPDLAKVETEGPILMVTHFPDCGTLGSGEEGFDWFFKQPKGLPEHAELLFATIQPISPEWVNGWDEWFLLKIKDIVKACITSPWKCVYEIATLYFFKLFDSKTGSYVVQVNSSPNLSKPLYSVRWENSCTGPYDEVPNFYNASFLVYAPEWMNIQ